MVLVIAYCSWRAVLSSEPDLCIKDLQRCIALVPAGSTRHLIITSQIYAVKRNLHKAEHILSSALYSEQDLGARGELYYFRGFARCWLGRKDDAIADLKEAIKCEYNVKNCNAQIAVIYSYKKDAAKAEMYFQRALSPKPNYCELIEYGVYLKMYNPKKAKEVLFLAISRNEYAATAYNELGSLFSLSLCRQYFAPMLKKDTVCLSFLINFSLVHLQRHVDTLLHI